MPYKQELDHIVKEWTILSSDGASYLSLSVRIYGNLAPKLQIGPRVIKTATGEEKRYRAGRLEREEIEKLEQLLPEIYAAMEAGSKQK